MRIKYSDYVFHIACFLLRANLWKLSLCLIISIKFLTKYDFMMNFNAFRRSICVKEANL